MDSTGHDQVSWVPATVRLRHVAPASRFSGLLPLPVVLSRAVPLSEVEPPATVVRHGKRGAV